MSQFSGQLKAKIQSDITALELILKQEKIPDVFDADTAIEIGLVNFQFKTPPFEYIEKRELEKCFKSVVSSVQDYMDQLIALKHMFTNFPFGLLQREIIPAYIDNQYKKELIKISTDSRFNTTRKLEILFGSKSDDENLVFSSLQSLFYLRNGLEHHKGIAKVDRQLVYRRIAFVTTKGREVKSIGPLDPGEGLNLTILNEEVKYDEGQNILISKDLLYQIIQNLLFISIAVLESTVKDSVSVFHKRIITVLE